MKRAGGRTAQIVRSASRRKKTASRFQFDITVDQITGLQPGNTFSVKWARGVKISTTKSFTVPKDSKNGVSVNEKISLNVTLYRDEGKKFDKKDCKLSVQTAGTEKRERTIAKVHFDLSGFAGVPSASTQKLFKMSDKVTLRATVDSRFVKSGTVGPGSGGASSIMSGLDGASVRSSDEGGDDLDDLNIDDVPEPEHVPPPSTRNQKKPASPSNGASSFGAKPSNPKLPSVSKTPSFPKVPPPSKPTSSTPPQPVAKTPSATRTSSFPKTIPPTRATVTPSPPSQPSASPPPIKTPPSTSSVSTDGNRSSISPTMAAAVATPAKRPESPRPGPLQSRQRSASSLKDVGKSPSRAEDDALVVTLRQQSARLSAEVDQSRRQREDLESDHQQQVKEMTEQLEQKSRKVSDLTAMCHSTNATLTEMRLANTKQTASAAEVHTELQSLRSERDKLRVQCDGLANIERKYEELSKEREELLSRSKRLSTTEAKCLEYSREVDRLTLSVARSINPANSSQAEEIERRIASLQAEKESADKRIKYHETHQAKIKGTYTVLSDMYEKLRVQHTELQESSTNDKKACRQAKEAAAQATAGAAAATASAAAAASNGTANAKMTADEKVGLVRELEDMKQKLSSARIENDSLSTDHESLSKRVETLDDRLIITSQALSESQRELEDLYSETEDLKGQRDSAMQRALSKGKSGSGSDSGGSRSVVKAVEDELSSVKEKSEREESRLRTRVDEVESEMRDLREDLDYEKNEKSKARDERDKMRETARALERRTSQAARANDVMHSLRRELSTHQMRTQDHESMIAHMKSEKETLVQQLNDERSKSKDGISANTDEVGEVLHALVGTKLALAEAQSEKQQLEFAMRQLRREEKAIQQRISAHASEVQTRLEQATEELDRLRKQRRVEDRSEFNELGSDVDY